MTRKAALNLTELFLFMNLIFATKGEPRLIESMEPVVGLVGDDVVLPCSLLPAERVAEDTVEWTRSDLNPSYVYIFRKGQELYDHQHPTFQHRTNLFLPELQKGNMSLKLNRIQLSDRGNYTCKFIRSTPYMQTSIQVLLVVGAVSEPTISVVRNKGRNVVLQCEAKNWYPKPEIEWTDSEGKIISHDFTYTKQDEYYSVNSSITVKMADNNIYMCTVRQQNIKQSREKKYDLPTVYKEMISLRHSEFALIGILTTFGISVLCFLIYTCAWKFQDTGRTTKKDTTDGLEMQPLQSEVTDLRQQVSTLQTENEHLKEELEKCQREIQELRRLVPCSPASANDEPMTNQ